jgi:hypothetical protein
LIISSCSKDDSFEIFNLRKFQEKREWLNLHGGEICVSKTDAFLRPEGSSQRDDLNDYEISDETIHSMSTCGILETLLDWRPKYIQGAWCPLCNPEVTQLDNSMTRDKVGIEFFKRNDYFDVVSSQYQIKLKNNQETADKTSYFEIILATDMSMSALKKNEKVMLLFLSVEKVSTYQDYSDYTPFYIMVSVMKVCKYPPFMKEINPDINEWMQRYYDPFTSTYILPNKKIYSYAKQFLTDLKI